MTTRGASTIVGKVENSHGAFASGGRANGFSQFKGGSICLPMFAHCDSFSRFNFLDYSSSFSAMDCLAVRISSAFGITNRKDPIEGKYHKKTG